MTGKHPEEKKREEKVRKVQEQPNTGLVPAKMWLETEVPQHRVASWVPLQHCRAPCLAFL